MGVGLGWGIGDKPGNNRIEIWKKPGSLITSLSCEGNQHGSSPTYGLTIWDTKFIIVLIFKSVESGDSVSFGLLTDICGLQCLIWSSPQHQPSSSTGILMHNPDIFTGLRIMPFLTSEPLYLLLLLLKWLSFTSLPNELLLILQNSAQMSPSLYELPQST